MSIKTLQKLVDSGIKLTPMMEQYYNIKKEFPDTLLLYRMGDFYELFFDDAEQASKILNITLTHRGKLGDTPIPMSGIPHHAANNYIDRITSQGLKAAICEQIEDPAMAKGIVKRAVTQVVSPAMPYDLEKAKASEHHYICSAVSASDCFYLVTLDFTTGSFWGERFSSSEELLERLRILDPREFLASLGQWETYPQLRSYFEKSSILITHLSSEYFDSSYTTCYLEKLIPSYKRDQVIQLDSEILAPIGALAYYITTTQHCENLIHIRPFKMSAKDGSMKVTLPTLIGLEIFPKHRDTYKDSILGFFDRTKTAMGARFLKRLFATPLRDATSITQRQQTVEYFLNDQALMDFCRSELAQIRDIERILAKISTGKVTASDLIALSQAITHYQEINKKITELPRDVIEVLAPKQQKALQDVAKVIADTLNDEIGASLDKGNLIKEGADKNRDRLAKMSRNAAGELLKLEARYREETGISKLKVKSNNVAGYFIEVSKSYSDQVPATFQRRQTLVNSERFTCQELQAFEKEVVLAKEKLERLEREIFKDIVNSVAAISNVFMELSSIISHIDALISLAWIALQEDFTKPEITNDSKIIDLAGSWHPLIKSLIKEKFVCHDLKLNQQTFFGLITGPNMAGKTTVMREVAIIQLLAQIGSFVPAKKAKLGLCDYLFSRLGASDDILKGQSTFMVEMAETSEIIRHASEKSLIILDEVGRGTSTYDGLSIAWALVEHFITKTRALTLFSTHYHELIELADKYPEAKNLTVETQVKNGEVHFLYRLLERSTGQSYGIYVAKLAGLPSGVLERSSDILASLEKSKKVELDHKEQLPLPLELESIPSYLKNLEEQLKDIDISKLTPLESLVKLDQLQKTIQ